MTRHVSPMFFSFPFSSVSFCFQGANYAYATRQGILTKIRACEHLQKFCDHEQESTHLIFASNSSKRKILRALSNSIGPFDNPIWVALRKLRIYADFPKCCFHFHPCNSTPGVIRSEALVAGNGLTLGSIFQ